jgi:hypothetical protein
LPSDRQLKRAIADLKSLERKCFRSRHRFAFYEYLNAVYAFYELLRRKKEAKKAAGRIAELFGLRKRRRTHPIRVIINATSAADEKTKSRWARALRYAWYGRQWWKDLNELFRSNGGPAGCAKEFAALHPRPAKRRASTRNEVRGLTIQPVQGVQLLRPDQLYVKDGRVFSKPT